MGEFIECCNTDCVERGVADCTGALVTTERGLGCTGLRVKFRTTRHGVFAGDELTEAGAAGVLRVAEGRGVEGAEAGSGADDEVAAAATEVDEVVAGAGG